MEKSCMDCPRVDCAQPLQALPDDCILMQCGAMGEAPESELEARMLEAVCCDDDEGVCDMTRIEETMEFARRIGAKKIGIATCVGLLRESNVLARILRANGFDVVGVCCKVGSLSKLETGLSEESLAKFHNGPIMCNPIGQARILNREQTDLNILMGLCVGHDTLYYKFCEGYCTTLVTKDRVLAHNPAGALYQTGSFYRKLMKAD